MTVFKNEMSHLFSGEPKSCLGRSSLCCRDFALRFTRGRLPCRRRLTHRRRRSLMGKSRSIRMTIMRCPSCLPEWSRYWRLYFFKMCPKVSSFCVISCCCWLLGARGEKNENVQLIFRAIWWNIIPLKTGYFQETLEGIDNDSIIDVEGLSSIDSSSSSSSYDDSAVSTEEFEIRRLFISHTVWPFWH